MGFDIYIVQATVSVSQGVYDKGILLLSQYLVRDIGVVSHYDVSLSRNFLAHSTATHVSLTEFRMYPFVSILVVFALHHLLERSINRRH